MTPGEDELWFNLALRSSLNANQTKTSGSYRREHKSENVVERKNSRYRSNSDMNRDCILNFHFRSFSFLVLSVISAVVNT